MALLHALLALLGVACGSAQLLQRPRCASTRCEAHPYFGQNEYLYTVDGLNLKIEFTDSGFFTLKCPKNLTLDNPALPRFESQLRVNQAQLLNCGPPRDSYAAVMGRLNVTALDKLKLSVAGDVTRAQLEGLQARALELSNASLQPGALQALAELRRLQLDAVRLPTQGLLELPAELEVLVLKRMNTSLPAAALARLPKLVNLTVRESDSVRVELAGALQGLSLEMPAVHLESALPPSLHRLAVIGWDARRPEPWTACAALESLQLQYAAAEALPAGWLRRCGQLRDLHVVYGELSELHAEALHGAHQLEELLLKSCALTSLPAGLLDKAVRLRLLDLSGNRLHELPGGLFAMTRSLQELNLSENKLTTAVFGSLTSVTSLTKLSLSNNIHLKDSCGGGDDTVRGSSPLQYLRLLTELDLRNTGASMICRDWRENMPLKKLDLERNNFTSIRYADLRFSQSVLVKLKGNNVTHLYYTRGDYELVVGAGETWGASVELDHTLSCDCHNYWAARALSERSKHLQLSDATCASGAQLRAAPAELLCDAPALCESAPSCACARRERAGAPPHLLRVRCEGAGLARAGAAVAPVAEALRAKGEHAADFAWQLQLAGNRISELRAAELPQHLEVLDVRHNNVSGIPADEAAALLGDKTRRVFLAHNPLDCSCSAAGAVSALRARRAAIADYDNVTCADRAPLSAAPEQPCAPPLSAAALAALACGALLLLAAAGALAGLCHPALRLRLKAALHARGWLPAADEPDDERRFDAFVSFSHLDERFVREELVARLEGGPAPYRLCVHYRDWVPGGWIPAQIAASVRASRRTVAVVSEHFLRSAWARAELQEAYALALRDARPRLVVVLLDAPENLPLDERLRTYLALNTYVRWGDPWFWQKLRLALPRGRGLAPPGERPASSESQEAPAAAAPKASRPPVCVVVPSPRDEPASPPSPKSAPSPKSPDGMELDLLVKPSCAAQCASDVTPSAVLLRSQV